MRDKFCIHKSNELPRALCFVLLAVYDMFQSSPRNILWRGFWLWQTYFSDHTGQYFHERKIKLETKCYREKLKHQRLDNTVSNVCLGIPWNGRRSWGRSHYTENVKSCMELRPPLFPSSVFLGSNGFNSHWILYLSKLRLQNQLYYPNADVSSSPGRLHSVSNLIFLSWKYWPVVH